MAISAQTHGKVLDYDQFIRHQIGRTRSRIKTTDVVTSTLLLVAAAFAVLFLEIILDHVVGLPLWFRRVVLLAGLAGGAAFAGFRIIRPIVSRVNDFYAAKTIEETDPAFKNSLVSYLDLSRKRGELPALTLRALESKAVSDLTKVEVDTVVNQRRLIHTAYVLSGIVVLFCLYDVLTPKSILDSVKRAFLADVVRPTNTQFLNIKPGQDAELSRVIAGSHVVFSTEVGGSIPKRVVLHYSVDGGSFYAISELAPGAKYAPWQTTIRNVQQPIDYFFSGGDAESRHYKLEVLPAPMVTGVKVDLEFPEYTGVPKRENVDGGNVEAIEGTLVTLHAHTNQPAGLANLDFGKQGVYSLSIDRDDRQNLSGTFRVRQSGSYTIKFSTVDGHYNPDPVVYDVVALKDRSPTVKFKEPKAEGTSRLASNAALYTAFEANDDFGLRELELHFQQNGRELLVPAHSYIDRKTAGTHFEGSDRLDLAPLKLKPGSKVEYWLEVHDTREPESNKAETSHREIIIDEPLSPKELAKQQDQQPQADRADKKEAEKAQANKASKPDKASSAETNNTKNDVAKADQANEARPRRISRKVASSPRPIRKKTIRPTSRKI